MNTKDSNEFKWTDDLIFEFVDFFNEAAKAKPTWCSVALEEFKASKQSVSLDWEIWELKSNVGNANMNNWNMGKACAFSVGDVDFKIWHINQVKRLQDGEFFTVGDEVEWDLNKLPGRRGEPKFKIYSFSINTMIKPDRMFINNKNIDIVYVSHAPAPLKQPKPRCSVCGGEKVEIRGKYPKEEKRLTCPTCTTERLEQINEISRSDYGQSYNQPKL